MAESSPLFSLSLVYGRYIHQPKRISLPITNGQLSSIIKATTMRAHASATEKKMEKFENMLAGFSFFSSGAEKKNWSEIPSLMRNS